MAERVATYSKIISPEEYNRIISKEHLYISASDQVIKELVEAYRPKNRTAEVVEIGCGPARILPIMSTVPNIHLTGIDHDAGFLKYAQHLLDQRNIPASVINADISTWKHNQSVDVFYSQGVHHHIGKAQDLQDYLDNIRAQLSDGGVYILSDEFLPEYTDENDRKIKAVIWYSHIISSAKRLGYEYLAQEEAKTLLDDLYEGEADNQDVKTESQIRLVLDVCTDINTQAMSGAMNESERLAHQLLASLASERNIETHGDITVDLSRGDYKICDSALRAELRQADLQVVERRTVGPVDSLGGMAIYVIRATT